MSRPSDAPPPSTPRVLPVHHLPSAPPRHALAVGIALLAASLLFGLMLLTGDRPFVQELDDRWAAATNGSYADAATDLATVLDRLGGPIGVTLPLIVSACLCVYGRWRSALFVCAAAVVSSVVVVLPLKHLVDRPRPPHPWVLVNDGSFPSGQVFSAATLTVAAAIVLFPPRARRWWWFVGAAYVVAMMWSRTWLHAQWLSDTLVGAVAGTGTCLVLWRVFAPLLRTEAERTADNSLWL
ncbi:phosphatase PAP2 family protein [Streptomyces sp. NPDC057271]|uniref:phosphatase PAP2 family protein n=1 Tax=unclassified Streptomyces TaxID=2593676 RepID=UPI00363C1EBB